MYYRLITLSIMLLFTVSAGTSVFAQEKPSTKQAPKMQQKMPDINVTDSELEKFVQAVDEVKSLQQNAQKKMIDAIEKEGLNAKRFVQINNIQNNPKADAGKEVSKEELESFNKVKKKVDKMQKQMQDKQMKAIEDQGIKVERYVEIARAAQRDPELRRKIQKMQSQ